MTASEEYCLRNATKLMTVFHLFYKGESRREHDLKITLKSKIKKVAVPKILKNNLTNVHGKVYFRQI